MHAAGNEWLELFPLLDEVAIPIVVDHFGHLDLRQGIDQPVLQQFLARLRGENWWIMISNGDRYSSMTEGWDDVVPILAAITDAAPDRTIWSTDWPHLQYAKPMPRDLQLVELLYCATSDPVTRRKVLRDNPAALFGV